MRFQDRKDAGSWLAERVEAADPERPIVLALPRGGVPVAFEVARRLRAPLDVIVARKLGAPGRPELGIGAIAEGGAQVVDEHTVAALGVRPEELAEIVAAERVELERRVRRYRGDRPLPDIAGRDVVLVDDGLATGVTARAAVATLHRLGPRRLLLAVPVCARQTAHLFTGSGTEIICVTQPEHFYAVGAWYEDFGQTTDEEVLALLAAAAAPTAPHAS